MRDFLSLLNLARLGISTELSPCEKIANFPVICCGIKYVVNATVPNENLIIYLSIKSNIWIYIVEIVIHIEKSFISLIIFFENFPKLHKKFRRSSFSNRKKTITNFTNIEIKKRASLSNLLLYKINKDGKDMDNP